VPEEFVGVWEPAAGFVMCEKAIGVMSRLAMEAGAKMHGREVVQSWRREGGGFIVQTDRDHYATAKLIFSGGAWTQQLVPALANKLVVTRQILGWIWPADPARFAHSRFGVWGIEQPDGSLAYGFPMLSDVPGLKLARHGRGQTAHADTLRRDIDATDIAEIESLVNRWLPSATGPVISAKVCMYTNSPDGHFIIDQLEDGVIVACGFSGHGFKFASVMGELLAEMAEGKKRKEVEFLGTSRFT
jgi:sarcosine oxidase